MNDEPSSRPSFSLARRWAGGFNALLGIVCLLAVIVMVNYLGSGWYRRWEWSNSGRFQLSPQTTRLLQSITNNIEVILCFDVRGNEEIYGWSTSLLRQYSQLNPRISVRTVDYTRAPGTAAKILETNRLSTLKDKDFIVFNSEGRRAVVFANELSDMNIGERLSGQETEWRRTTFKGELLFSSKLAGLTYPRPQKAYFISGHGEHSPDRLGSATDYAKFANMLRDECNVPWEKTGLLGTNDLSDASLLIIAGPAKGQFSTNELARLDAYLRQGGRALILLDYQSVVLGSGLENYLTNWNVGFVNGVVQEDRANVASENDLLTARTNPEHPITRSLGDELRVRMVMPRVVGRMIKAASNAAGLKVDELAFTSDKARLEIVSVVDGKPQPRVVKADRPLPLTVAVEQGGIAGVSADRGTTRLVVVGDSLCFNNEILETAANRYFAGFVVNWLLDRPQAMLNIPPKPVKEYRLVISHGQVRTLSWLMLAGMPGGVLALGALVWLRRRR
jgi:hypothetical protein